MPSPAFSWLNHIDLDIVIDFRGNWSEFHTSRLAPEKHCGSLYQLWMRALALTSTLFTANDVTLHSFKGHITLGYKVK